MVSVYCDYNIYGMLKEDYGLYRREFLALSEV